MHRSVWICMFLSYFLGCETGRWAWPRPMVTCFNNVYSASRDLSHWNCWERQPSMRCIPPASPDALFCSEKDEMLQYLDNGLMAPVGLPAFWNATKHGLCARVSNNDTPFVPGIYSNEHRLFCVTAPKKTRVVIKERLTLTNSMFGWNPMQSSPQREHQSNESFLLSSSLPWILYLVEHLLTRCCA